ncbi:hypothetical protein QM480_06640 [Flectobacillus sp. DC10W]|uniref:Uncharacterized protein n=1 Tax=Flectobacillus longus TaxID=2984207 RepID=A0ABT6YK79_9BACT|nr:hypothetical protein [Flectobacillus longus]MDI9863993.1 hypothetical protein [Flectobacillus longus]
MKKSTKSSISDLALDGEQMTLFSLEGSRASPTVSQENGSVRTTSATFGPKCLEQFGKFNRSGSWAKMFSAYLVGMTGWYSKRCNLNWKLKGTKFKRLYFQLVPSMRHIGETEFGLLPTITQNNENVIREDFSPSPLMVVQCLLPTPVASDATVGGIIGVNDTFVQTSGLPRKINQNGTDGSVGLARLVQILPTVTQRDYKGGRSTEALRDSGRSQKNNLADYFNQPGKTSQLNPRFVAEMMGFPANWTEIPFLKESK